jgi:hypothetical protein
MEQQRAEVLAEKHRRKVEFTEWEVRVGRDLAFEIGKREYEAQRQREIEKEQIAILVEKSDATDAELNIRRSNVNQRREGLINQIQAVPDLENKIMKAKHKNSNSRPNPPSEKRASTRNRSKSRSSQAKT